MMLREKSNKIEISFHAASGPCESRSESPVNCSDDAVQRLRDQQREAARMLACLTKRERQVMQLVSSGLPNKTVARQLQLSVKTVEKHRGRLMKKLRLQSMCELFRFWFVLTWDQLFPSEPKVR